MMERFREVQLGVRDYGILEALEKWGVLGLGQLEGLSFRNTVPEVVRIGLFFNEIDRSAYTRTCYKRLRELELAGMVKAHFYLNHPKVFSLTERGHRALMERGLAKLRGYRRGISEYLLAHELAVNAVGLMIDQLLRLNVRSEADREMAGVNDKPKAKRGRLIVPDLWIVNEEWPVAIEVELTQKAEARYKELWQSYKDRVPYGTKILYLTAWPEGVKCLLKLTREFEGYLIFVCDLKTFRESGGRCPFVNRTYYHDDFIDLRHLKYYDFHGDRPRPSSPQQEAPTDGGNNGNLRPNREADSPSAGGRAVPSALRVPEPVARDSAVVPADTGRHGTFSVDLLRSALFGRGECRPPESVPVRPERPRHLLGDSPPDVWRSTLLLQVPSEGRDTAAQPHGTGGEAQEGAAPDPALEGGAGPGAPGPVGH